MESTLEQYGALKASYLAGELGTVDKISALKKSISGRVIPKSERDQLEIFERMLHEMQERQTPMVGRIETDYYRNSRQMGKECEKDGGYWDSNVEMTARAFACYVMDKLPYASDYLAGHAESAITFAVGKDGDMTTLRAYPQGEERRAINAVFDEIVADLKLQHILTHTDVTLPLHVTELREEASGQLTMFGGDRPSVLGQLAEAKARIAATLATPKRTEKNEPEI